jgi:membrane protease YdiL (CAAX protease family)
MIDTKPIVKFLVIAFAISWTLFLLPLAFTGLGDQVLGSIRLIAWAVAMWGPGVAALLVTILVEKKPIRTLRLNVLGPKRFYLWAWFLPPLLAAAAIPLSIALGLARYDPNLTILQQMVDQMPAGQAISAQMLLIIQLAQGILIGPLINVIFTLGEELGWRGFLLPRLEPLGQWKAILISGVIWGVWHAPVIAQGFNYPGHPIAGIFFMIVFTVLLGALMSWLYFATRSTWAPAFGHASINAWGGLPLIFLVAGYNPLFGGTIASVAGWIVIGLFICLLVLTKQLPVRPIDSNVTPA